MNPKIDEFKVNYSTNEWSAIQQQSTSTTISPYYFYYVGNLGGEPFVKKANISSQLLNLETNKTLTVKDLATGMSEQASAHVRDIKQINVKL